MPPVAHGRAPSPVPAPPATRPALPRPLRKFATLACLALASLGALPAVAQTEVSGFGSNPGNLRMFKYVPAGLPANAPLVVAMHGCSQTASSYDAETGWQMLADRWHFALLLPQQQSGNNASGCFNWFTTADTSRGQGEPLSIKQMVDRMILDHGIAGDRVYATGLSAGGAMTAVMLATYPDVFAGGAILSGLPYRCATSQPAAFSCMNPGSDLTPSAWGDKVRAAGNWNGPWPIVSIWHGDADYVVRPANLTEAMEQWTNVHGIDAVADVADTVAGYPHRVYKDAAGTPRVETYTITGMGHGTPVDPGTGESQCGTAGAYILDANICSSYHIGHFWGLDNLDGVAPTVNLTSPADGSTVSGNVALAAVASDDVGVERVEFLVDGVLVGSDTSAPYAATWDAGVASNGSHAVQARARDLVDNVGTSAVAHVTVTGGDDGGGAPLTLDFANEAALDGYVKATGDGGGAAVGTLEAYLGLAVGRGTDGKFNRSLLSFDTSALPDGATVTSATLTVAYRSAYGDPWSSPAGNALVVDVHTGCLGACTVEASDWANTPTASAVAQVPAFSGGSQASTAFSTAGRAAINKGGRTQVRLRFAQDPLATHYLWLDNGASAILSVTYTP
ncbi:extracellular catalytic domain type 1 short-chain-length polyhydroxyalkanoate depolymerase [Marilutibacter spongiae]|uniref:PHB depolymerase family esterase n=1 Tax=Marilutibacter spongiae TaxID=2025720 RepID=A0A7W3TJM5_9GAMM|nr:PHB depolymerase family esterase [Lysobacter spongiae]MBB1059528.1 PHB depolymerase family esterase [Lysobacter spongiae]